jgi:replicative DNA helicase
VIKAAGAISEQDLVIADQMVWQFPDVLSLIEQGPARMVVIDSLDLIRSNRNLTHEDEVEEVLRGLARAAREHDTTIVLTTNLARLAEGGMPTLEDVRFSNDFERYAGTILLLHREPDPHIPEKRVRDTWVVVAHDNAGARGSVRLVLQPERQRFEEP